MKTLAINKKVKYNYQILEIFHAGIKLRGFEVKSVKAGKVNLKGSFVHIKDGQLWLVNAFIAPYQPKNMPKDYNERKTRKLLITKKQIQGLIGKTAQKGLTLVPLALYNKYGQIKLKLALARGKKKFDKRQAIKKREFERKKTRLAKQQY